MSSLVQIKSSAKQCKSPKPPSQKEKKEKKKETQPPSQKEKKEKKKEDPRKKQVDKLFKQLECNLLNPNCSMDAVISTFKKVEEHLSPEPELEEWQQDLYDVIKKRAYPPQE